MSHLRASIRTMTNKDLIEEERDLTILQNVHHNSNKNYRLCHDELLQTQNYDLYMSLVRGESMVNPNNQDIKFITTSSDEYTNNYVEYSNKPRKDIIIRTPCYKPLTLDKNYYKNGNYKSNCKSYNQCMDCDVTLRDSCSCNNNEYMYPKFGTPKICMESKLKISNLC